MFDLDFGHFYRSPSLGARAMPNPQAASQNCQVEQSQILNNRAADFAVPFPHGENLAVVNY